MSQKSKIFKIPLRFEKKTLKPARVRSLSKIIHVFVILNIKSEVLLFQLPLKVDSTVNHRWGPFFNRGAPKMVHFLRLKPSSLIGRCPSNTTEYNNTLVVMLLKSNICCFFCQKLLILSKVEKNREHK